MKKLLNMLCSALLVMACVVMLGCSSEKKDVSNSKYVGTWKAVSAEVMGQKMTIEEVLEDKEAILVLNNDGTGTLEASEDVSKFTWVETSEGPKASGDVNITFKENEDGQLVGDLMFAKLFFEKQ